MINVTTETNSTAPLFEEDNNKKLSTLGNRTVLYFEDEEGEYATIHGNLEKNAPMAALYYLASMVKCIAGNLFKTQDYEVKSEAGRDRLYKGELDGFYKATIETENGLDTLKIDLQEVKIRVPLGDSEFKNDIIETLSQEGGVVLSMEFNLDLGETYAAIDIVRPGLKLR